MSANSVSNSINENDIVTELKKRYDKSQTIGKLYIRKHPYNSSKVIEEWHKHYNYPMTLVPPLQPEIDLIFEPENELNAIEVKFIKRRKTGKGLDHSFYEGIDQALALLRWGFDHVALWQFFDQSVTDDEMKVYGAWTWRYLHTNPKTNIGLGLPLDYTMLKITRNGSNILDFFPYNWNEAINTLQRCNPLLGPNFSIHWQYANPLKDHPEVKYLRTLLINYLHC